MNRLLLTCLALLSSACVDATAVLDEPDVESMEILVDGSLAVTVSKDGGSTGSGILLTRNVTASIEAVFRDENGSVVADEPDFRLDVTPASIATLSFTRSGQLRGSLTGFVPGNTTAAFRLRHVSQNHDDFPPVTLGVVIH